MASGACRIASAGQQRPLRFWCARGSRLRFPVFGPSCTRIPAVNSAGCRKRCCLINLERYGRFPTQSLHYGGPDAQLHPDGRTAFHLAARRQVQLFVRRGSRLELTGAGETLLACAERLADDYRRMQYEMSLCADAPVGELRLGASTTIAQYLLPPILARFTTRFPGVRVAMMSGNSDQVEQALGGHGIDLGMVESLSRRQGLHYTVFAPDELVLVARTGGPYSRTESITADELREIPLVLREGGSGTLEVIKAALGRAGIRIPQLNVVMRLGSTEGIKAFVRNSDAMAIVSVISVVDELRSGVLRIIDLEDLPLRRDFAFVHVEAEPSALVRQFIEFARADR